MHGRRTGLCGDERRIVTKKRAAEVPKSRQRPKRAAAAVPSESSPGQVAPEPAIEPIHLLRLPRADGATIVVEVLDAPGVKEYLERVRAWFDAQPEELTLFEESDPYARSKRELAAFALESNAETSVSAPPAKTALRLEVDDDVSTPSRDDVRAPIVGSNYPVVSSVTRRAISSLVLSAASAPGAFTATDRGLVFVHDEALALGQVMLRPLGESRLATPTRRLHAEQIEEIRRSVPAWSPLDEDTLEIMLSHVANNAPDDDGLWTLYVDQMLDARALRQKSRSDGLAKAGYRADDRADVMRSIARLDSAWARVYHADDPSTEGDEDFARVVLIAEVRRRSDRLARIRYRPGTWYDPKDATTRSPRKVLEYDPYREAVEKHLARYFLQRSDEADEGGVLTRTVQELCTRGGVAQDRNNPKRMRERLTKALDRLVTDGAIIRWTYADDPRTLPTKGYVDSWLAFRVRVSVRPPNMRRYRVASEKPADPTR
jgi:hypothetical protein